MWHGRTVPTIRIVQLDADTLRALADGVAPPAAPVPLTDHLAGPEHRGVWRRRSDQVDADPADAAWVTGVVWDPAIRTAVGRAGFHGPPDERGMVEVGYAIDPAYRRRGYARAALAALLERAATEPAVTTVRASVRPDNVGSRALVAGFGFVPVGEQWDDEDGLETVYERPSRPAPPAGMGA
jgi:RimJ/RimL family protein N-acetyltransferase